MQGMPALSDPFQDDPNPEPPKPTASPTSYPGSEVRRPPSYQPRQVSPVATAYIVVPTTSLPYQVAAAAPAQTVNATPNSQTAQPSITAATASRSAAEQSVLKRASAEQTLEEPAALSVQRSARPILRANNEGAVVIPRNPLR